MADVGGFVGALVLTFLLGRLMLWLLKRWKGGYWRMIVANVAALIVAWVISGFGHARGNVFKSDSVDFVLSAGSIYLVPQLIWLAVDLFRERRRRTENPRHP